MCSFTSLRPGNVHSATLLAETSKPLLLLLFFIKELREKKKVAPKPPVYVGMRSSGAPISVVTFGVRRCCVRKKTVSPELYTGGALVVDSRDSVSMHTKSQETWPRHLGRRPQQTRPEKQLPNLGRRMQDGAATAAAETAAAHARKTICCPRDHLSGRLLILGLPEAQARKTDDLPRRPKGGDRTGPDGPERWVPIIAAAAERQKVTQIARASVSTTPTPPP